MFGENGQLISGFTTIGGAVYHTDGNVFIRSNGYSDWLTNILNGKANATHTHAIENVGCTINTTNFIVSDDSWCSLRKIGHIVICAFSLTSAKSFTGDSEYKLCKMNISALHPVRGLASCSGNIIADVSIQQTDLNYIKIAPKTTLASGKTVKGELIFFV